MKKITLFAIAFVAISFASCKKDRVCTCKSDQPGDTEDKVTYIKAKKSDARANCLDYTYTYTDFLNNTTTVKVDCTLN